MCPVLGHLRQRQSLAVGRVGRPSWLDQTQTTFAPYAQGAYQNYIDPTLPNWAKAYYGTNLPRLMEVKKSYDPDNVFHFTQSIPLPSH